MSGPTWIQDRSATAQSAAFAAPSVGEAVGLEIDQASRDCIEATAKARTLAQSNSVCGINCAERIRVRRLPCLYCVATSADR